MNIPKSVNVLKGFYFDDDSIIIGKRIRSKYISYGQYDLIKEENNKFFYRHQYFHDKIFEISLSALERLFLTDILS